MKPLSCCGWESGIVHAYTTAWNAGHLVQHWITFPNSDVSTIANLVAEVRKDCCRWGVKPCSYHEGFMDAAELAAGVLAGKEAQSE